MSQVIDRLLAFAASLRLAIITILLIAGYLAIGTLYEARYGTRAAGALVYQNPIFYGLMALLAINVMAAAIVRFPWKRHQAGFVITHIGIEVLLLGCLIGARWGVDGRLILRPGQSSELAEIAGEQLVIRQRKPAMAGQDQASESKSPAGPDGVLSINQLDPAARGIYPGVGRFITRDWWARDVPAVRPVHVTQVYQQDDVSVELLEIAPAVRLETAFAADPAGEPAARVRIVGVTPDRTAIDQISWFSASRPAELFGSQVRLRIRGLAQVDTSAETVQRARGELVLTREGNGWRGTVFGAAGVRESFIVEPGKRRPGWMGLALTVEEILEHATPLVTITPIRVPADQVDASIAAAKVRVSVGSEHVERWLVRGEPLTPVRLGDRTVEVAYGFEATELPFSVRLVEATVRSGVPQARVELIQGGEALQQEIAPNQPGAAEGRAIYLSSIEQTAGGPIAFLSVRHDPGWPIKYLGSGLIVAGTTIMFIIRKRDPGETRHSAPHASGEMMEANAPAVAQSPMRRCTAGTGTPTTRLCGNQSLRSFCRCLLRRKSATVRWGAGVLLLLGLVSSAGAGELSAVRTIPIQHGDRVAPLDVVARETVRFIRGRETADPLRTLLDWSADSATADQAAVIAVNNLELRKRLSMKPGEKFISPASLRGHDQSIAWMAELAFRRQIAADRNELAGFTAVETAALELRSRLMAFDDVTQRRVYRISTIANPASAGAMVDRLVELYRQSDTGALNDFAMKLSSPLTDAQRSRLVHEVMYWRVHPFRWVGLAYGVCVVLGTVAILRAQPVGRASRPRVWLGRGALGVLVFALLVHGMAFWWRIEITGWAPVTNMYETVVWVGGGAGGIGLFLAISRKAMIAGVAGSIVGMLACIVGDVMPPELGAAVQTLAPVLRSNLWLTVHVLTVVSSYAAFALALVLGNVLLWKHARFVRLPANPTEPTETPPGGRVQSTTAGIGNSALPHLIYRCLQIGVVLIAAGTVLGAMWADVSWGRFWGWDPKEVWALVVLLTYLALLHGKVAGWVGPFGLAAGAVAGFITVLMSWYGVNFVLGVGLHSYGFGAGGIEYVLTYVALQLGFVTWATWRVRSVRLSSGKRPSSGLQSNSAPTVTEN